MNILPQNNRGAEGQTASLTRTAGTDVLTTWKNFKIIQRNACQKYLAFKNHQKKKKKTIYLTLQAHHR